MDLSNTIMVTFMSYLKRFLKCVGSNTLIEDSVYGAIASRTLPILYSFYPTINKECFVVQQFFQKIFFNKDSQLTGLCIGFSSISTVRNITNISYKSMSLAYSSLDATVDILYYSINFFEKKNEKITLPEIELLVPASLKNNKKLNHLPIVVRVMKEEIENETIKNKNCLKGTRKNKKTGKCESIKNVTKNMLH
jgi:hypothetical protein